MRTERRKSGSLRTGNEIRKRAAKHFEGLAVFSTHSAGRRAAGKAGCKPVHFSLAGCPLSCYSSGSVDTASGHFVHKLGHAETLADLLREYVTLYGQSHSSYSTYTNYVALVENHILPFWGAMRLTEFSPKTIAVQYSRMRTQQNMTPQILSSIHKLLHNAFEQAVLWEYADRNPLHKQTAIQPK